MKKLALLLFALFAPMARAQTIYPYPAGPISVPLGTYQSVTMPIAEQNVKTVLFTTDCGTIKGVNPTVSNSPATVALYSATAQTCHLTGTSVANPSLHQTVAITFTASPTPVTTHPRLYITAAMQSGLQAKFTAGSPMATNLVSGPSNTLPGGATWYATLKAAPYNWKFTCESGTGLPSAGISNSQLELAAYSFAFLNYLHPNTSSGTNWGCYGHDVWLYLMNQMTGGSWSPGEDEWRGGAQAFVFTTDWLLNTANPAISSTPDLTEARAYVAWMLKYTVTSGFANFLPSFTGAYNSSSMFASSTFWMRYMGNNYDEAAFFYLAALPLTFNDTTADSPPLSNTCSATRYQMCSDGTAGSAYAYFRYFTGGVLYDQWAIMEDPDVSWQAYQTAYGNLPTQPALPLLSGASGTVPFFGEQRGGEPAEGSGYGYSVYALRLGLNAIYTAGYADPTVYGPQMSLMTSSWWDMRDVVSNEVLTGFKANNGDPGGTAGIQPTYSYLHTGDSKHYFAQPVDYLTESAMLVFDSYTGRTDRTNALLWPILNTAVGGIAGNQGGCNTYCGIDNNLLGSIAEVLNPDLFIALGAVDPGTLTPPDPRPSMPADLYNGSYNQHLMVRSGFSNTDTLLTYYCENSLITHEHGGCGMYEVYANNEWITKGRVTFDDDYNYQMASATQNNQLSIMNPSTGTTPLATTAWDYWFEGSGGIWQEGTQAGLIQLYHSELPGYSAMIADMTNGYNGASILGPKYVNDDVTAASRSMIYLRGTNQTVTYDRAATNTANAKATYLNTTGTPSISGNTASWLTQSGTQKAYWTSLLPTSLLGTGGQVVNAKVSNAGTACGTPSVALSGAATVFASQIQGSSILTLGVSWPGSGYGSAPSLTITGCTGATGTAVVNSPTNVLNNVTLTEAPVNNPPANPVLGQDWEVADTLQANCGVTTSCNLLNVLEWGSASLTKSTTTLEQSSAGQNFDGARVGSSLAMFMRSWPGSFTNTTFPASSATSIYVSDLTPSTTYTVTGAGTPSTVTTDTAGVAAFAATGTGNISLSTGGTPTGSTPTFSPAASTYTGSQSVTLTTASGTVICYNTTGAPATNGASGCTTGTLYSGPVTVSSSETVYAVAGGTGFLDSPVGSAAYVIQTPAATPVLSPASGTSSTPISVLMTSSTGSANICYTVDGTTPSANEAGACTHGAQVVNGSAYAVTVSLPLEAIATAAGYNDSGVASGAYTITVPSVVGITAQGIFTIGGLSSSQ